VPELPDVTVYVECLAARCVGETLERVRVVGPSLLRSVDPPLSAAEGKRVLGVRRLGKRIVFELEDDLFLIFHLMIAGRFHWMDTGGKPRAKLDLARLEFSSGHLLLTEAGSKKRASLHLVRGQAALRALDPGGLEPFDISLEQFCDALTRENHTVKRTLTDPHVFSGIGNAYSDEILHAAKLSPLKLTQSLTGEECGRLFEATRATLQYWIDRLRADAAGGFPEKVTAFREGMAVHGRFKKPCPVCASPVQRIVYADNECNYCATCQTGGRLLADRSLSRLLKDDWPKWLET